MQNLFLTKIKFTDILPFMPNSESTLHAINTIFNLLKSYSEALSFLTIQNLITSKEVEQTLNEWQWLLSRLDNPVETTFFSPGWLPVCTDNYDLFLDTSTSGFEIFKVEYFFFEPYTWFRVPVIRNIHEFLFLADTDAEYLEQEQSHTKQMHETAIAVLFATHRQFGLEGRFDYSIHDFYRETITDNDPDNEPETEIRENSLLITGVTASVMGILPHRLGINVDEITCSNSHSPVISEIIPDLNALVFLITKGKERHIKTVFLRFAANPEDFAWFRDDTFFIRHSDAVLINEIYQNFGLVMQNRLELDE